MGILHYASKKNVFFFDSTTCCIVQIAEIYSHTCFGVNSFSSNHFREENFRKNIDLTKYLRQNREKIAVWKLHMYGRRPDSHHAFLAKFS